MSGDERFTGAFIAWLEGDSSPEKVKAFRAGYEAGVAAERERAARGCTKPAICTCTCGEDARAEEAGRTLQL